MIVFAVKRFVGFGDKDNALGEPDDGWDARPEKDEVENPPPGLVYVQFVDAEGPDDEPQQSLAQFVYTPPMREM